MRLFFIILLSCFTFQVNAQKTLDNLLRQYNTNEIPYISVQELAMPKTKSVILDAREQNEYDVSHLKNSIFVGYNHFDIASLQKKLDDKNQDIVVYCSLGIRSETIAKKLKKAGYTKVRNLYGGIFEWKNMGFSVFDSQSKITDNVHAFSKEWGKWLTKGTKIYD